jgi:hypothetical protein
VAIREIIAGGAARLSRHLVATAWPLKACVVAYDVVDRRLRRRRSRRLLSRRHREASWSATAKEFDGKELKFTTKESRH